MNYEIRSSILGFEDIQNVKIDKIDDFFSTMQDLDNKEISFTIVNPYALREYSFDLPVDTRVLLDINENSNISVYNVVVLQTPPENSSVNFLAPIIVNNDNKKIAQAVLSAKKHPDFGMAEKIKSFNIEEEI